MSEDDHGESERTTCSLDSAQLGGTVGMGRDAEEGQVRAGGGGK